MKNILMEGYLETDYVKAQPDGFKNRLLDSFEKSLAGEIEYMDFFGSPMIYSIRDAEYYIIKDGKLEKKLGGVSENDVRRLSRAEFNEEFDNLGDELGEKFYNKADIENQLQIILSPEDLEKWFVESISKFDENDKTRIKKAFDIMKEKHEGQYRDEGIAYYTHPAFAAIKGIEYSLDTDDIIVLLLHDTIEDTTLTYDEIKVDFGENVADAVLALSKKQNGNKLISKEEYYEKLGNDEKLATLKGIDRLVNLYSLNFNEGDEKKERYLNETKEIIMPIIDKNNPNLVKEFEKVLDYIEDDTFNTPEELLAKVRDLKKIIELKGKIDE